MNRQLSRLPEDWQKELPEDITLDTTTKGLRVVFNPELVRPLFEEDYSIYLEDGTNFHFFDATLIESKNGLEYCALTEHSGYHIIFKPSVVRVTLQLDFGKSRSRTLQDSSMMRRLR